MLFQKEKISAQLIKNYAQLKNCKDPVSNDLLFPDVTKAIMDAKSMAQIERQLHGNRPKNGNANTTTTNVRKASDNIRSTNNKRSNQPCTFQRWFSSQSFGFLAIIYI